MKKRIQILIIVILYALMFVPLSAQTPHTISGIVKDRASIPISGVNIRVEGQKWKASTGKEGKFTLEIPQNSTITFSSVGYEPVTIHSGEKKWIEITLKESQSLLPEITVTSTLKNSMKFVFAPSDLELIKDMLYLKTRYKIPSKRFQSDSRVIIQPILSNNSRGTQKNFSPIVYDGKNYDILLRRGNVCGDRAEKEYYSRFAQVIDPDSICNQTLTYADSCTVDDINDLYTTEVRIKISTFCQDEYRDTIRITNGIIYPMRFFNYNLSAMDLDNSYIPKQTPLNFNEKGEMHLRFRPEDANIYENEGKNAEELRKMKKALDDIDKDRTKTLTTFQIIGYTSPEGTYEYNLKLAKKRMKNAEGKVFENISEETIRKAKVDNDAVVESWTTVCELMEKDSIQEVSQLKELIKRARGNHNEISWGARRIKIYPLIRDRYLPRLRRVEYFYEYSELRTLNKDEIDALYKKDPQKLTASEFWSYIMSQKDATDEKREALYREALSIHPDLMIAANNLASLLIKQNRADTTLLKPFITQDAPSAILVNQTVAYLQKRDFKRANHFAELLPDNKDTEIVKALAAAMDGKYQEAYPIFEKQGGINQAILLLSMKQNSKAWEVLQKVEDTSPDTEYVKAIAANRLNNINEAVIHLRNAITQKPSLKEIAQKDGDVLDLLDLLDLDKK